MVGIILAISRHYDNTEFITGLRAVAVLMVFLIHSGGELKGFGEFFSNAVSLGKYGVEMFFVISGFTIYHQFLSAQYHPRQFLIVRFLRISIPYFFVLIVLGLLVLLRLYSGSEYWLNKFDMHGVDIQNYLSHFIYLGALIPAYSNSIIGVEWSLNIEAAAYLIFFVIAITQPSFFTVKSTVLLLIISGCFYPLGLVFSHNLFGLNIVDPLSFHYSPFKWIWLFFLGGLVYHARKKVLHLNTKGMAFIVAAVCYLVAIIYSPNGTVLTLLFSLMTIVLIVGVKDNSTLAKVLNNKLFLFLGSLSFSFYLIHLIVIHYIGVEDIFHIALSLCLTIILSFLMYMTLEVGLYKKIKRKFV